MEKILDYWKYNYLICFDVDWSNNICISGSSNRTISVEMLLHEGDDTDAKDSPLLHSSVFSKHSRLLSRGEGRLSENQHATLAATRDLFKRIKQRFLKERGVSLDTAQILFIMPIDWTEELYKDRLRSFFVDVEWMTPKDNDSKLVMVPTIQTLAGYCQDSTRHRKYLDRERTSVLFSMQRGNQDDGVKFSYTFFKMQGAKELIAMSKSLASSDFLLVPSIKSSDSIYLANLDHIMYNAVKKIVASARGIDVQDVSDENTAREDDPAWTIVCHLSLIYDNKFGLMSNKCMEVDLENVIYEKSHQLLELKSWTCSQLIAALMEDVNVKHYFTQVSSFFKEALDTYGAVKNSPDGIQHYLFYSCLSDSYHDASKAQDYSDYMMRELLQKNIIQPGKDLSDINLTSNARFAMQQPYKMVQIANAFLPPIVVGDRRQNSFAFHTGKRADSLIAPNSFYVQASFTETQVRFILNKTIEAPSSKNDVGLFTIQERSVEIEDMVETVSHALWNHYQAIAYLQEQQHLLLACCRDHDTMAFLSSQYEQFKKNVKKLIDAWFAAEDIYTSGDGIDTYHPVSVDQRCACALNLSPRLLLQVGLRPVIASIAATIAGALSSNDYFGLYHISALICEKNLDVIKNPYFSFASDQMLKQAFHELLKVNHSQLLLLFHDKHTDSNAVSQYLGRGSYSQVPSMIYTFSVILPSKNTRVIVGVLKDGVCKRIPLVPFKNKRGIEYSTFTYSGLTKEHDLSLDGIGFTFLVQGCSSLNIKAYVSGHPKKSTHRQLVGTIPYSFRAGKDLCSPVTVRILPKHDSSSIKFVASFSLASFKHDQATRHVSEVEGSINVIERLVLKKKEQYK